MFKVILSAELFDHPVSYNNSKSDLLERWLNTYGLMYTRAQGYYKGSHEQSFIVTINNPKDIESLEWLAFRLYEQESILIIDSYDSATLHYSNGSSEYVGRWREVPKKDAIGMEGYTLVNNSNYYSCI